MTLHFAELYWTAAGERVFDVNIEGIEFDDVDIVQLGGGVRLKALTLETAVIVSDGFVSISLTNTVPPQADSPKVCVTGQPHLTRCTKKPIHCF